MQEINFSDGYYSTKYSSTSPQIKLTGVNYNRGSLVFNFSDADGKISEKSTRDPLEMLILSEILYGSEFWKYNASKNIVQTYNNSNRESVGIKVSVDESFINEYKDTSVAFKVYLSTLYNNLKSYGGYDSYPKLREISYLPYTEPIEQPENFKVKLFEYQKKSIAKMLAIEKKTMYLECSYNYMMPFGEVNINYNPSQGKHDTENECKLTIKTKGGILADDMGLGKTAQLIALLTECFREENIQNSLIIEQII